MAGKQQRGIEKRRLILNELARRYDFFEPPLSGPELAKVLGMTYTNLTQHVAQLRIAGWIHADSLWITRAGFLDIGGLTH